MKPEVLNKQELKKMVDIMSNAFLEHQNWKERIPSDKKRLRILSSLFHLMFRVINKHGEIFVVRENNQEVGYITYMDPNDAKQISFDRVIKTGGLGYTLKFIFSLNPKILRSMMRYYKAYNAHLIENSKAIHLYSTAINKEYRGKGLMGKALRSSFQYYFDKDVDEIVLETSDESNIPIYQKLGFKIIEVIKKNDQTIYFFSLKRELL